MSIAIAILIIYIICVFVASFTHKFVFGEDSILYIMKIYAMGFVIAFLMIGSFLLAILTFFE